MGPCLKTSSVLWSAFHERRRRLGAIGTASSIVAALCSVKPVPIIFEFLSLKAESLDQRLACAQAVSALWSE